MWYRWNAARLANGTCAALFTFALEFYNKIFTMTQMECNGRLPAAVQVCGATHQNQLDLEHILPCAPFQNTHFVAGNARHAFAIFHHWRTPLLGQFTEPCAHVTAQQELQ